MVGGRSTSRRRAVSIILIPVSPLAISRPWSQVTDRRSCSGSVFIASIIAVDTVRAVWFPGRCSSITNPLVRSTSVPIADLVDVEPMIRSPSAGGALGLLRGRVTLAGTGTAADSY